MLIATLPTIVTPEDFHLSAWIIGHPLIGAVRYNTGGASPLQPKEILKRLQTIAESFGKKLYVDLEGRQIRVAHWVSHTRKTVTLNRKIQLTFPAKAHFRGMGWFDILAADEEKRRIYIDTGAVARPYYFGESQSVHIVASELVIEENRYLSDMDHEYVSAAIELGISTFMLSFVEQPADITELHDYYWKHKDAKEKPELVLKIESQKGLRFLQQYAHILAKDYTIMAARDDFFLSFVDNRQDFIDALRAIILADPNAILASRIMSGLERDGEVSLGDMSDMLLMHTLGYKNFMLADEAARSFPVHIKNWEHIILPMIEKGVSKHE